MGLFWSDTLDPDLILSKRYKVRDLTVTNTGLDNDPPEALESTLRKFAGVLDNIYDRIGPFNISSAYRSSEVNDAVNGSSTSRHMEGDAADISPTTMTAEKFWGAILLDSSVKNSLGHIAYKKHQINSIHLTLPFYSASRGYQVLASPQVTHKIAGSVSYLPATDAEMQKAKDIYLGVTSPTIVAGEVTQPSVMRAGVSLPIVLALAGGTGLFLYALAKRRA